MSDEIDLTLKSRLEDAERDRDHALADTRRLNMDLEEWQDCAHHAEGERDEWKARAEKAEALALAQEARILNVGHAINEARAEAAALREALEPALDAAGQCSEYFRDKAGLTPDMEMHAHELLANPLPRITLFAAAMEVAELDMEYDAVREHTAATAKQGDLDKWRELAARLRDAKARFRELAVVSKTATTEATND